MKPLILFLTVGFAFASPKLDNFEGVKKFPFITYREVWTGTPAQTEDVAVPNVLITYGKKEDRKVIASAVQIAYYLGQWTEDMGITPGKVRAGRLPSLVAPLDEALSKDKNLIVVGTNNKLVKELGLEFDSPTLKVIEKDDRKILIVGGKDPEQVVKASHFLAHRIVGFKAGAYRTFFSFVKLRGMIEHGDFVSALDLIEDASGLSACGKNMSLASPMMGKFPPEVKKVVKKRNKIMYVELVNALKAKDKDRAKRLWQEAMLTCYQCHQGINIKRLRKFVPNEEIHSKHQRIASRFGLSCSACHSGATQYRGY